MNMHDVVPWARSGSRMSPAFRSEAAGPFAALRQEMDRLFDETLRGFGMPVSPGWPNVEVTETDKEIRATFEVPGVDEKDIQVLIEDGDLVVRGEKRSETEDKQRRISERMYGRFERRIPLGQEVEEEGVRAEFRNGLLTVTLPRSERAAQRTRRIPVSAR
ncbi:Hsp20/alpha crystallin family protein [Siccirubricoccus deserti]|uniref:Hsp20/alpha crystallin family protein n=2 Tax=Siccirubricoccus deserti TaxID=2013562 RepID=A0A9X0R5M0_9PROT|nr:Hsp20/alpha crystallin family protein [Siccirubricoccus deserti]